MVKKYFIHENDVEWRDYQGLPEAWKLDKTRFKVLVDEDFSKDLYFGTCELDPGEKHELHHHAKEAEFYYVVEGTGLFRVEDDERQIGPGMGIYMSAGAKHAIYNNGDKPIRLVWAYNSPRNYKNTVWDCQELREIFKNQEGNKLPGQK